MGLLEEEWSKPDKIDMVLSDRDLLGHHQQLLQEVKKEEEEVDQNPPASSDDLNSFGPLKIEVVENER